MKYKKLTFLFLLLAVFINPEIYGQVKPIADGQSKFLGCAYSSAQASGFSNYWNQVTPENGGKWGSVEGTRGTMRWTDLDAAYNLARKYGFLFKEHTLIWGAQQPSWIGGLDTTSQRQETEQWFSLLAARYKDIDYIDVVNEPLHNAPNGMLPWGATTPNVDYAKALGGAGTTGCDWIITSFRLARKYFPNAKLLINEYSVINSTSETNKYFEIIKLLQADSLIDGIGEQAHAFTTKGTSTATMKANLDKLGSTGLPIYLTEMDVDGLDDLTQLKEMQRIFPLFWKHPSVKGITFWGFRYGLWRTDQGAYLITQSGKERAALKWLRAYVNDSVIMADSIALSINNDTITTITKGATVNIVANVFPANTTVPNVNWSVSPSSLATIDSNGKLTATAAGKITVTALAWDGSGTKGTMQINIEIPDGVNNRVLADKIRVYPNPAENGKITIDGIYGIEQIDLVDLTGRKMAEYRNLNQSTLDMQVEVPNGMYILNLFDRKQTYYRKVIFR
jgi:endo-1,4-beta-xylanase